MPLNLDKLKEAVLSEDDFAHELRVGATPWNVRRLLPLKDKTEHGGTYTDSNTGKLRQFDYRFKFIFQVESEFRLAVFIAAECKNIHLDSPLLVSGLDRNAEESFYMLVNSTFNKNFPQMNFSTSKAIHNKSFFPVGGFVGKSLLRPKLKKENIEFLPDGDVYERWSQALASAVDLAGNAATIAPEIKSQRVVSIVLPIVVLPDDCLLTLKYNPDGSINGEIEKVNRCDFFVGREIILGQNSNCHPFNFSHIQFMTMKGFTELISGLFNHDYVWRNWFQTCL